MIPNNLEIGDTFTDGGLTYKVIGISAEGYISTMVTEEEAPAETEEAPVKRVRKTRKAE